MILWDKNDSHNSVNKSDINVCYSTPPAILCDCTPQIWWQMPSSARILLSKKVGNIRVQNEVKGDKVTFLTQMRLDISTQLKNFIVKALKEPRKLSKSSSDQNKIDLHHLNNEHLYFFCFQSWSRLHTCRWQIQRNSPPRPLFRPLIDWVDNICHTCHCCTKIQLNYTQIYYNT